MKNKAFTLIEALVALLVLNLFLLGTTFFVGHLKVIEPAGVAQPNNQFEVFVSQLEVESRNGEFIKIGSAPYHQLELKVTPPANQPSLNQVMIQFYGKMIRKTTNIGGHQPMLTDVKKAVFSVNDLRTHVLINIEFLNGEVAHGKWIIP